jgi:O-acetyl-ADP-ribose deacetylase (regulator of RNase III)
MKTKSKTDACSCFSLLVFVCQVDGIANSVAQNFDLSKGAIAQHVLKEAGQDIQTELYAVYRQRGTVNVGDVIVTKAYRLNASYVFHGALERWSGGQNEAEQVRAV